MALLATLRQPLVDLRDRSVAWLTRGEKPAPHSVTLTRRRIYILPTGAGYAFVLILIVMLLGAINYSNSMAFVLTFLLVSLGTNSMWQTHRNLLGLEIVAEGATPVFAGQHAQVRVTITNPHRTPCYGLRLRIGDSAGQTVDVPAQAHTTLELPWLTHRRGQQPLGRIRIDTRYPLGLFEAWSWPSYTTAILTYPKPADRAPAPPLTGEGGDVGRPVPGEGDEFAGLRKYARSDSPRHVAWKAVARSGRWLTKEFQTHRREDCWLRWDDVGAVDTEQRLSVLCRWVLDTHQEGIPYGLDLPGQRLSPAASEAHRHECLKALALFRPGPAENAP